MYIGLVGNYMKTTQPSAWLNRVEQQGRESQDVSAVALIPFYSAFATAGQNGSWGQLDVTKSLYKRAGVDFGPITTDLLRKYLQRVEEGNTTLSR